MAAPVDSMHKLEWAEQNFARLRTFIDEFVRSHPPDFRHLPIVGSDIEEVDMRAEPIPPQVSLWIGDLAHSLRCALEYLPYAISALSPDDKKRKYLGFPICSTKADFTNDSRTMLKGVAQPHIEYISKAQPYNAKAGDISLTFLQDLNNEDKHHAIRMVVSLMRFNGLSIRAGAGGRIGSNIGDGVIVIEGNAPTRLGKELEITPMPGPIGTDWTLMARIRNPNRQQLFFRPRFETELRFTQGQKGIGDHEILGSLRRLIDLVAHILEQF